MKCIPVYGASWHVNSGYSSALLPTGLTDIDIVNIDSTSFAVLYTDLSNHAAMTLSLGQVNS